MWATPNLRAQWGSAQISSALCGALWRPAPAFTATAQRQKMKQKSGGGVQREAMEARAAQQSSQQAVQAQIMRCLPAWAQCRSPRISGIDGEVGRPVHAGQGAVMQPHCLDKHEGQPHRASGQRCVEIGPAARGGQEAFRWGSREPTLARDIVQGKQCCPAERALSCEMALYCIVPSTARVCYPHSLLKGTTQPTPM